MKKSDIRRHLKPYSIYRNRKTTINHAFASAISPVDIYDEPTLDAALRTLNQEPDTEFLQCVYCGEKPGETWDHIIGIVKNSKFSGHGHQINNLIPCCKSCNSQKGNKDWLTFLQQKHWDTPQRVQQIEKYIRQGHNIITEEIFPPDLKDSIASFEAIKQEVLELLKKADYQAEIIRNILSKRASGESENS